MFLVFLRSFLDSVIKFGIGSKSIISPEYPWSMISLDKKPQFEPISKILFDSKISGNAAFIFLMFWNDQTSKINFASFEFTFVGQKFLFIYLIFSKNHLINISGSFMTLGYYKINYLRVYNDY